MKIAPCIGDIQLIRMDTCEQEFEQMHKLKQAEKKTMKIKKDETQLAWPCTRNTKSSAEVNLEYLR